MFRGGTGLSRTHAPRSWFLRLTIAGCLAAGLVSPPASAAPAWSRPANVSKPEKVVVDTVSVIGGYQGNAIALWQLYGGEDGVVRSAARRAGGSWSAPHKLFDDVGDIYASQIAVDPIGNVTAVWDRPEGRTFVVQSATRPPGGSWSTPVNLSTAGDWAREPQVAVDSQGNATAVWEGHNPQGILIQSASRPAGGSWSAPINLSKPGRNTEDAQIAVGPQGDATAIWARSNGRDLVVQGATRPPGGNWSTPVDISTRPGQGGFYPRLVVDSWGNATAVWKGYDRNRHSLAIQGATRPLEGGWSPPTDVSNRVTRHTGISEPQIEVDPQGIATVVWVIGARGGGIVQAATSVRG
jgi:hypothetical protein